MRLAPVSNRVGTGSDEELLLVEMQHVRSVAITVMQFDHPPGIENSRYSNRTPPCFDTGGHICQGLHIRCQSDSTDISEHVAYLFESHYSI